MMLERVLELLEIEHKCMLRGAHNECDRDCANCELVQDDKELDEMYTTVIKIVKQRIKQSVVRYICERSFDVVDTHTRKSVTILVGSMWRLVMRPDCCVLKNPDYDDIYISNQTLAKCFKRVLITDEAIR